jgi:hypothetical protein
VRGMDNMKKVAAYITIISAIIIAIIGLFDINNAIKLGADCIAVAVIIGVLVAVTKAFEKAVK